MTGKIRHGVIQAAEISHSSRFRKWVHWMLVLLYFLAFAGVFAMLLWRCRYGIGTADETFYLSVPLRFLQGDRPLVDETHLSQFSFLTMVPAVWVYLKIAKTTEGIVLAFRYIYTVLWSMSALFLYFRARKIHHFGAMCASLMYQSFAPYGIMALSYNSLGILYLTNAAIFLLCARRHRKVQYTLSGIFYAGAVLCCPYLAIIYFVYSAAWGITCLKRKKDQRVTAASEAGDRWKYFTLGVAALAALVLFLLLKGASPQTLLKALAYDLNDPQHADFSIVSKTGRYFRNIAQSNDYFYPMVITVAAMILLTKFRKSALWFMIACGAVILYLRRFMVEYAYINYLMVPMTFAGIYILAVTENWEIRQVGLYWLIPGIIYTYCLNYSSSQDFFAISCAAAVPSTVSLIMGFMYCGEMKECYQLRYQDSRKYLFAGAYLGALLLAAFQLRYEIPVRAQSVYWEAGLMKYEEQATIEEGPEKGIIATVGYAEVYNRLYPDVKDIRGKRVLFLSEEFWMWLLDAENENAAFSGWLGRVNEDTIQYLREYYELNPHKKPELIFLENKYDHLISFFSGEKYDIQKMEHGHYLISPRDQSDLQGAQWP